MWIIKSIKYRGKEVLLKSGCNELTLDLYKIMIGEE